MEVKKKSPFHVLEFGHSTGIHCDVEIKTQGGWKINAHSFHLATCSKFLKECLRDVLPGRIPTIYLPDTKPSVVQGLLTFIYTGLINIC